ncbi:MAG: hypothetical protein MJK14_23155 [Rivularia sp. ALOHA_DT_140]|nr:hypothetical protein [Rivularia sp. ALOHA_DT_140]
MEPTFLNSLSDKELLAYVRMHPQDKEAFHLYMDRLGSRHGVVVTTDEELEAEMRKRINKS